VAWECIRGLISEDRPARERVHMLAQRSRRAPGPLRSWVLSSCGLSFSCARAEECFHACSSAEPHAWDGPCRFDPFAPVEQIKESDSRYRLAHGPPVPPAQRSAAAASVGLDVVTARRSPHARPHPLLPSSTFAAGLLRNVSGEKLRKEPPPTPKATPSRRVCLAVPSSRSRASLGLRPCSLLVAHCRMRLALQEGALSTQLFEWCFVAVTLRNIRQVRDISRSGCRGRHRCPSAPCFIRARATSPSSRYPRHV